MFENELAALAEMSNKFGSDADYVLAGGGNTSFKSDDCLFVKGSGTALATIKPDDFVKMDRRALEAMWDKNYPAGEKEREDAVLEDMMDARVKGETRRPSVETLLHELFEQKYVLHVHPALVNALTCSVNGREKALSMFPEAVWVPACKPGYILALNCREAISEKMKTNGGKFPQILFLENHGIFVAGDNADAVGELACGILSRIHNEINGGEPFSDFEQLDDFDIDRAVLVAPVLRMLYSDGTSEAVVKFECSRALLDYDTSVKSLTPDHIVYTKASQLVLSSDVCEEGIISEFKAFTEKNGYKPRIVIVKGLGIFACGKNAKEAETAREVFVDAVKIAYFAKAFGGVKPMTPI